LDRPLFVHHSPNVAWELIAFGCLALWFAAKAISDLFGTEVVRRAVSEGTNYSGALGEAKMINGCRSIRICDGELLLEPLPVGSENARRVVVQVLDPFQKRAVIDVNKPSSEKSGGSGASDYELEMGNDKSLGGEYGGLAIW
jgi:hypothetical protein